MIQKNLQFLIFCAIFWLINQVEGQTAKCDYKNYASYYTCNLDTGDANYNEELTRIDGQQETGHTDTDVKLIRNDKDNKLKTFSSIFCKKFSNLEVIRIVDAELESIDVNSLSNCKNLDKLLLSVNKIRELPEFLLFRNSKLTQLWIHDNQLTTLHENLFLNQKELEFLYLSENQINFLPSNIFRPLMKLKVLELHSNKLQSINPDWFVNLQNLEWLILNGNQISEIPSKCFASLRKLESLWIYQNKIKILKSNSFDGLQNLHLLNLDSNEISDLPVGVFTPLKNIQNLGLDQNTTIHSDSFDVHNQLTKVYLQDNKINAIDEKFIDNTAVTILNMTNNICSLIDTGTRSQIKPNLKKCFDNYQPRTISIKTCGKGPQVEIRIIGGDEVERGMYPW